MKLELYVRASGALAPKYTFGFARGATILKKIKDLIYFAVATACISMMTYISNTGITNSKATTFQRKMRILHSMFYPIIGLCSLAPFVYFQFINGYSNSDHSGAFALLIIGVVIALLMNIYRSLVESKYSREQYKNAYYKLYLEMVEKAGGEA